MSFYFIGLDKYISLGQMIADHIGQEMIRIHEPDSINMDFEEDDIIYGHFFLPKELFKKGCNIIAPDLNVALRWDNKIYQSERLKGIVPMPKWRAYNSAFEMLKEINLFDKRFVTLPYGNTGYQSIIHEKGTSVGVIYKKLKDINSPVRVSEYFDKDFAVSLHILIGSNDIYVSPIVEQILKDEVEFLGAKYPANIDDCEDKIIEISKKVGEIMRRDGFFGLAGIDLMVKEDQVMFVEVNPRKMGSTVGTSYVMKEFSNITLPAIEYEIMKNGELPFIEPLRDHSLSWSIVQTDESPNSDGGMEGQLFKIGGQLVFKDLDDKIYRFEVDR